MADIQLNLIYNDNNAQKRVDDLIRTLQSMESKRYTINLDSGRVHGFIEEAQKLSKELDSIKQKVVAVNNSFDGRIFKASFNDFEISFSKFQNQVQNARLEIINFYTSLRAKKNLGIEIDTESESEKLVQLKNNLRLAEEEAAVARRSFENIGKQIDVAGITGSLDEILKKMASTEVERVSDILDNQIREIFGEKFPHEFEENWGNIHDIVEKELADNLKIEQEYNRERLEEEEKTNARIELGHKKQWEGIREIVTGTINILQQSWNTWKSLVEAPLNLTGVSSLVSMLESMEGSLLLNQISSNITGGFSDSVERFDILKTFPSVMEAIGFSAGQSSASMDKLYQSVLGLPTAFEDIVQTTQYFALVLGDLDKATDLAIAANNAFVASGATSQQITSGMRQLQYLIDGTKLRSTQWYSLIRSMPVALREVGDALGYPDFNAFTADLMAGKVATDDLIDSLIDVGFHSEKIAGVVDIMKSRVQASLDNVRNAAKRMGNTMLEALDNVLRQEGGKGIAENIKGVSGILDHIAQVAAQWISTHGPEIQSLIDKFMSIDWASVIPNFFEGLVEFANNALDNVGDYISDIGNLLVDARQFFNDIEHSSIWIILTSLIGATGSIAQIITGIKTFGFGNALLVGAAGAGAAGAGAAGAGAAGTTPLVVGSAGVAGALAAAGTAVIGGAVGAAIWEQKEKAKSKEEAYRRNTFELAHDAELMSAARKLNTASNILSGRISKPTISREQALLDYEKYKAILSSAGIQFYYDVDYTSKDRTNRSYAVVPFGSYTAPMVPAGGVTQGTSDWVVSAPDIPEFYAEEYKVWEEEAKKLAETLDDIHKRQGYISADLDELDKKAVEWANATVSAMEQIYGGKNGKGGKFFSVRVEEAFSGLFRNTLNDFGKSQEKYGPMVQQLNDQVVEAINNLPEGERSKYQKAWSDWLGELDFNNPESMARLQQAFGEGGETILETLLMPKASAEEFLTSNIELVHNLRKEILTAAGEDLSAEEESAIEEANESGIFGIVGTKLTEYAEKMSSTYLPLIKQGLGDFSNDVIQAIQDAVDRINSMQFYVQPNINYSRYLPKSKGGETAPLATGGYLFAPIGTDTIPAMLTPGEYVQRRAAVEHFGRAFMDRINALDLRGALRSLTVNGYATPYSNGGFIRSDNRTYKDNHAVINQTFNHASGDYGFRRAGRFVRALG